MLTIFYIFIIWVGLSILCGLIWSVLMIHNNDLYPDIDDIIIQPREHEVE